MEPQPGARDSQAGEPSGVLLAAGRMVGFLLLVALALTIIAGVVLIPPYARLAGAQYELECLRAGIADAEGLVAANDRLIAALPHDEVLTMRLAMSQEPLAPSKEVVVRTPSAPPASPPDVIRPDRHPRPPPPAGWIFSANMKLKRTNTRRGLLLLAGAALVLALFLFAPPEKYRRQKR